jgi:hypothetical protein
MLVHVYTYCHTTMVLEYQVVWPYVLWTIPVHVINTRINTVARSSAQTNFFHIAIFLRTNNLFVEFLMLFVYHAPSCRQSALAIYYVFLQQCQFRKPKTLHNNRVKALHSLGIQLYTCTEYDRSSA